MINNLDMTNKEKTTFLNAVNKTMLLNSIFFFTLFVSIFLNVDY